jgi:hypothetical protein
MGLIDFSKVSSIDEFVFCLATCAVSLESIYKLQQTMLKLDLLDTDEREATTTIAYNTKRVFHDIHNLLEIMGSKTQIDTVRVATELKEKMKENNQEAK